MYDTIRIGVSPWPPGVDACILDSHKKQNSNCKPGIELDILLILLKQLGINSYKLIPTMEKGCGTLELNGKGEVVKVSGLMGLLYNRTIDITGNMCGYNISRLKTFGATWPALYAKQAFLLKAPREGQADPSLTAPLPMAVWLATFGVFVTLAASISLVERIRFENSNLLKITAQVIWELPYLLALLLPKVYRKIIVCCPSLPVMLGR